MAYTSPLMRPAQRLNLSASLYCALIVLAPASVSAAPLTWDRTRSSVSTCGESNRQIAPGGGASYHLSVEIGGIASTQTTQMLLY